jgi:sarcosine oxidase, subunit delta
MAELMAKGNSPLAAPSGWNASARGASSTKAWRRGWRIDGRREGPGSDVAAFEAYLFLRDNPKGPHLERWRHVYGCGKWFIAARDTVTMQVFGTYPAQSSGPPADIAARLTRQESAR